MKKEDFMLRITVNDALLFKYLLEEKFIHIDLLKKYLGSDYEESSYRRRLSSLKKEGYIRYENNPLDRKHLIFPTEKAKIIYEMKYDELKEEVKMRNKTYLKYFRPGNYIVRNNFVFKDLYRNYLLTELRFLMEELGVDYWIKNTMYYNEYTKNPDAIFSLGSKTCAINLIDSTRKFRDYEKDFIGYNDVKKINFTNIFYIFKYNDDFEFLSDIIKNKFIKELVGTNWKHKYRIAKYDDLENGKFISYNPFENKKVNISRQLEKYNAAK